MADYNDDAASKLISVVTELADDKRSVMVRLGAGNDAPVLAAINAASVDALITALGAARAHMLEPIVTTLDGPHPITAYNPRWMISTDSEKRYATFAIRYPGLGWSIYGFPRHEVGSIARWLRKVTSITETNQAQSPQATTLGSDSNGFLLSSEGLGFYYYGKGEKHIGPNPFEQVEFDSDRAAGIVAGSITETRLAEALKSRLKNDKPGIVADLFQPSGALGSFRTKIDLSYLMGLISDVAFKDLTIIKNIRNDFAHKLNVDTFDFQSIRDRCMNLSMIEDFVGPVPDTSIVLSADFIQKSTERKFFLGLPDYETKIKDPRFRFTMTAQIISNHLGEGSDQPQMSLPFI